MNKPARDHTHAQACKLIHEQVWANVDNLVSRRVWGKVCDRVVSNLDDGVLFVRLMKIAPNE